MSCPPPKMNYLVYQNEERRSRSDGTNKMLQTFILDKFSLLNLMHFCAKRTIYLINLQEIYLEQQSQPFDFYL
ncbi:hypothetical protein Mapa_007470 [Marchantia paleacea]|nr:hypothetical protein Mapa_007470 [Marchantia paleacea]